jgi:hypothetical protein
MEALAAVRNEEIRLRDAGLLQSSSSSVLAARSSFKVSPPSGAPSSVVPSSVSGGGGGLKCDWCGRDNHVEAYCYRKKKAQSCRGGHSSQGTSGSNGFGTGGSQRSSAGSETQEMLMLLRRLAASTPAGAASSVTQAPAPAGSATASQSSSPGIFPWILDSGASFHMTPDRTSLSSISTPSFPITVQTADGSALSVAGRGTLLSSSFHVPAVSYVPKLTMQLISAGQLTDHGCRVILDSDSCCI